MLGEVVYIEGRKQWDGREDEKSMIIVSYAVCIRVPAGSMAGLLQQPAVIIAKPPRTSNVLLLYHHF